MNGSLDFRNLPALMQTLDKASTVQDGQEHEEVEDCRPRFDHDQRQLNHFNVNKMTYENQAFATMNRGSFVDNITEKGRLPDYTNEKPEFWTRLRAGLGESEKNVMQSAVAGLGGAPIWSSQKNLEQQAFLKNLETPFERTDLYDEFDIHHEMLSHASFNNNMSINNSPYHYPDEIAIKTNESQRTNISEKGTGRALIPETGIESKTYHSRQCKHSPYLVVFHNVYTSHVSAMQDYQRESSSTKKFAHKRVYDLTKDSSESLGDRLAQIIDLAAAGSTIKLPAREIEVPSLLFKKHFRVQGQPGTSLFFKASTLTIDLSSEQHLPPKDELEFRHVEPVVFSEVQFHFSIDLRTVVYSKYGGNQNLSGAGK